MAIASSSLTRPVWVSFLFALLGGTIAGTIAKFADESPIPAVGMITTYFGVWVALIAVIAAWSRSWSRAILCTVSFLLAMLVAYYVSQMYLFGFFSTRLFLGWTAAALVLAPPFAALTWPARKVGWRPALGAALPIGFLLHEAYSLRLRLDINDGYIALFVFDTICAFILLLVLSKERMQQVRIIVLTPIIIIIAAFGFNYMLPYILGVLQ